jgi:hypothetical protein
MDKINSFVDYYDRGMNSSGRKQAYYALTLIKRLGKHDGFSAQMVALLDYYLSFTKDCDWEKGQTPIVFQSLCRTAQDFCLSMRQIQRIEKALNEKKVLSWKDSPNNKRYGTRNRAGRLVSAYGVDLSPLVDLIPYLQHALNEKKAKEQAWQSLKRTVHSLRKNIRDLLKNTQGANDLIDDPALNGAIRPNMCSSKLQTIIKALTLMVDSLQNTALKNASNGDKNVVHKEDTKTSIINKATDELKLLGLDKIAFQDVINFITRHKTAIKVNNWTDLVQFSEDNKHLFGISDHSWHKSCQSMTKIGASLAFLLLNAGMSRENNAIYNPNAYYLALIARAEKGALHLGKSIY